MRLRTILYVVWLVLSPFLIIPAAYAEDQKREPPMKVVIVRDSAPDCEPLCPQWIAAEGEIVASTPALFKRAIKNAGKAKLQVLIQSGGGNVRAAVEIGRMIRKAGLDVGVGWTNFKDVCKPGTANCKLPPENQGIYHGLPYHTNAYCSSACPLILAGGVNRMAGWGTYIGEHQVRTNWVQGDTITYREKYYMVKGKKKVVSRKIVARKKGKSYTTSGLYKGLRKELTAYLNEMGVGLSLFDMMEKAPPSSIYWMSADELSKTKLLNSSAQSDTMLSRSVCKGNPLPSLCVLQAKN
jgi:hypothetical protein